jgi:hypothetical protein
MEDSEKQKLLSKKMDHNIIILRKVQKFTNLPAYISSTK